MILIKLDRQHLRVTITRKFCRGKRCRNVDYRSLYSSRQQVLTNTSVTCQKESVVGVGPGKFYHLVRVTVGAGPPVLQVASPLLCTLPRYPDAAASVCYSG